MGRLPFVLFFALGLGLTIACKSSPGVDREVTPQERRAQAEPFVSAASRGPNELFLPSPTAGERAPFATAGDTIVVHNRICAMSRTLMGPETLGQFVSRVRYEGTDLRFVGKTFLFNQCCAMCIERFPERWAQGADEILAYHGVSVASR